MREILLMANLSVLKYSLRPKIHYGKMGIVNIIGIKSGNFAAMSIEQIDSLWLEIYQWDDITLYTNL